MASSSSFNKQQQASLTTDGISEEFFELLWTKDELNFGPSVNIPDTVIFKYGQPTDWYFTAKNGRIKKKSRANLIGARIEEAFTKHILGYDVIASFITVPLFTEPDPELTSVNTQTTIEFLDKDRLTNFLYNRKKEDSNGILQRFVEPKGVHNELIRAIWSPKVCLLERAENIHQLHDHRYGVYERCVTLEGPEYYITSAPLRGPVLAGQIQKICENVVTHISDVTFGQKQVTRLVANFKVDSRDKIWLTYSTSIRINDALEHVAATARGASSVGRHARQLVNIDNVVEIPSSVNLNPVPTFDKVVAKRRIQCVSCAQETLEDMRHPVTYKSVRTSAVSGSLLPSPLSSPSFVPSLHPSPQKQIIKHYEHVLHIMGEISGNRGSSVLEWPPGQDIVDAAGGVGFGCLSMVGTDDSMRKPARVDSNRLLEGSELRIPPVLRYLHPKLTGKSYHKCRRDPLFLYKTAVICEPCYLVYAEFTTMLLRMGGDLSKMLTPDPGAVRSLQEASVSTSNTRPSSADWRAMSTVNRSHAGSSHIGGGGGGAASSSSFVPGENHRLAKKKGIGLRSSDSRSQPSVPRAIRKLDDSEPLQAQFSIDSYGSMLRVPSNINTQLSLDRSVSMTQLSLGGVPFAGAGLSGAGGAGTAGGGRSSQQQFDLDTSAMIAERERHFFSEIAKNPQLKDQHPLMHLISAHQKLKMADAASGVVASKASGQKKSLFGVRYGKQSGDKYDALGNIYGTEQPYMFKGELIAPAEWRKQKQAKVDAAREAKRDRMRRKKARQAAMNAPVTLVASDGSITVVRDEATLQPMYNSEGEFNLLQEEEGPAGGDITSTKSARKHRDFLRETLKKIEGEADKSADYMEGGPLAEKPAPKGGNVKAGAKPALGAGSKKAGGGDGRTVKISEPASSPPTGAPPAPAPPSSPGFNNLDDFFRLASVGGEALPPRADTKSAGLRDARTADSSRPSTTAASSRGAPRDSGLLGLSVSASGAALDEAEAEREGGAGLPALVSLAAAPSSRPLAGSSTKVVVGVKEETTTTSVAVSGGAFHSSSLRRVVEPVEAIGLTPHGHAPDERSVGSFTVQSSEADDASVSFSFSPDPSTAHLLQGWGAEKVHSERHDAHLSTTQTTTTQSHSVTHAQTQVITSVSTSTSVRTSVKVEEASKARDQSSSASLGLQSFDSGVN
jgi:hypothetical protein